MRYRTIALILMMSIWFGCGSDEMGTLELKINNPKESSITQARVRVNGKERASLTLSVESHFIDLDEDRYIIGVDFLDGNGRLVATYAPKIIEIKAGEVTPIEIPIRGESTLDADEILIEKWILKSLRLERTKDLDPPMPLDPNGNCLRIGGGKTVANAWVVEVKDKNGNSIKEFIVSNESTLDSGRVCVEPLESNEAKRVYKGDVDGQFTTYRGRREDEEIIFEGIYITRPPGNLRMVIDLTKDPTKEDPVIEFTQEMFVEAIGKGSYENHILRGTAQLELNGDLLMSQELELYRKR